MQGKPRVGLVLMRAEWPCSEAKEVLDTIQEDTQDVVNRLQKEFEILGPWVVYSSESLQDCQQALRETDMDMVVLAFQTWSEDTDLVSLVQAVGSRPLVLWCYLPWRRLPRPASHAEVMRGSGPVGTFGALGTLRNLEVPFLFTFGAPDDPRLVADLCVAGRAARVRRGLRSARFGLVPSRNDRMQSTFVDEFRLLADFGPMVQYISIGEIQSALEALPGEQVDAYLHLLQDCKVDGVSEATLRLGARAALCLARMAVDLRLDIMAVNDDSEELQQLFQLRPALYPGLLQPTQTIFQPEGDLGAALANYILHHLTGSPTMFLEMWFWDEAKNQVVGGHTGIQNPLIALEDSVWISQDNDFCRPDASEGAQLQLMARPGRVTLFQLRGTPKGWQATTATGVCLEGQPWVESYPHAILRLDTPMEHFLNRLAFSGATQHWVMVYGNVLREIQAFCQMEMVPLEVLTY